MARFLVLGALCLLLAACSRPLTEAERDFAESLFGDTLDTSKVRVSQGAGLTPPPRTIPGKITVLRGTERSCVRVPAPDRSSQPAQAFALRNGMFFTNDLYSSDMARPWPRGMRLPQALIFAHELTHVWQWQNRATSGYSPGRALAESFRLVDPYYSPEGTGLGFAAFGYEQQAAIVEDFVCFTMANPRHPRRAELRNILAPVLPVEAFEDAILREPTLSN